MAETLKIKRWYNDDCTIGRVSYGGFHCFSLELPWLDNTKEISCIPEGIYLARKHYSQKYGWCIAILDVPDRTDIRAHPGNYTRQILGCILTGDSIKYLDLDNIPDVTNSRNTLDKLLSHLPNEFKVEIYS